MSNEPKPDNQWVYDAIKQAKQSALPLLLQSFITDEEGVDIEALVDGVELALMTVDGTPTEQKLRDALRPIAEPYAQDIGTTWEKVADAIIGTLEWTPPDKSTHILDSWGGKR
jgi:hypothetical protein